jgi:hypothetical protein
MSTDEAIFIHIISNLTRDYDDICNQLENKLGDADLKKKVTITKIKNRLRNKFNKLKVKVKSFGESTTYGYEKSQETIQRNPLCPIGLGINKINSAHFAKRKVIQRCKVKLMILLVPFWFLVFCK